MDVVIVRLTSIVLDPRDARAVLILQDAGARCLPLWVDDTDAAAVAAAERGDARTTSAPALLVAALTAAGGAIDRVELRAVHGGVLRAMVTVAGALGVVELPARASHAIAAAIHAGAPVLVEEAVIAHLHQRLKDAAARSQPPESAVDEPLSQSTAERWNTLLLHLADKLQDERPS